MREVAVIDGGPVLIPVNQGQVICAAEVRVRDSLTNSHQDLIGGGA